MKYAIIFALTTCGVLLTGCANGQLHVPTDAEVYAYTCAHKEALTTGANLELRTASTMKPGFARGELEAIANDTLSRVAMCPLDVPSAAG